VNAWMRLQGMDVQQPAHVADTSWRRYAGVCCVMHYVSIVMWQVIVVTAAMRTADSCFCVLICSYAAVCVTPKHCFMLAPQVAAVPCTAEWSACLMHYAWYAATLAMIVRMPAAECCCCLPSFLCCSMRPRKCDGKACNSGIHL
jgi:hypothetical protein